MPKILITSVLVGCLLISWNAALGGIGPDDISYGEIAYTGPGTPTLCNVPDGSGSPLTSAMLADGTQVDATLTLYLFDVGANPIADFPAEDMWLESVDGGLIACPAGTIADGPTDQNGTTFWIAPLRAGGASQALTQIMINGVPLWTTAGFNLHHNSPDITGDLAINLADVSLFAVDYHTGYTFRSDLFADGVLSITDLGRLATAVGANCP